MERKILSHIRQNACALISQNYLTSTYFKTGAFNSYWPSNHIRSTTFLYHKMNCITLVNNCHTQHLKNCTINETDVKAARHKM